MRIILLTSKLNFETAGGSVVDLDLKARALSELGHEVSVITAFSYANKITKSVPYKVYEEMVLARGLIGIQQGAFRILKKYENLADVFYIDGHIFLYGAGLFRILGGRPPVVAFFNVKLSCFGDSHGTFNKKKTILGVIKRSIRMAIERYFGVPIANHLDALIFTTPMVEKVYLDFGFQKSKSHILPDFTNTEEIIQREKITSEILAKRHRQSPVTIFCSGRMIPEKGFDLVIKAFALLKDKERYRVILSGGGPDAERLKNLVRDLNLEKYFFFPGWVPKEKLVDFFRQAQIFILPKWWIEYSSVLLIEAMAYGLPCIVPGGGGLEWLAEKGVLTFKDGDVADLAVKIEKLGSDPQLRIDLGKHNFEKAAKLDYKLLGKVLENICVKAKN